MFGNFQVPSPVERFSHRHLIPCFSYVSPIFRNKSPAQYQQTFQTPTSQVTRMNSEGFVFPWERWHRAQHGSKLSSVLEFVQGSLYGQIYHSITVQQPEIGRMRDLMRFLLPFQLPQNLKFAYGRVGPHFEALEIPRNQKDG